VLLSRQRQIAKERCFKAIRDAKVLDEKSFRFQGPSQEVTAACLRQTLREKDKEHFSDYRYYQLLPRDHELIYDPRERVDLAEYYFSLSQTNVTRLLDRLQDFLANVKFRSMASIMGPEFYLERASHFLLSPAYGEDCLRISFNFWRYSEPTNDTQSKAYFDSLQTFFFLKILPFGCIG